MSQHPYDSILFLSFGGPEGPDDVMPFLRNVTRGRGIPDERLLQVAHHYEIFGGISPINQLNRSLIRALEQELQAHDIHLPVFWGNRNWHPLIEDTLSTMAEKGFRKSLAFVTSAYSSYSGCRQYLDDIDRARAAVGDKAPDVEKLRGFFNHPLFIEANADQLAQALQTLGPEQRGLAQIVFTAHSVPTVMSDGCLYVTQLKETASLVAASLGIPEERWQLAYQSRSGPPTQPWLEPDICDVIRSLHQNNVASVAIAPIGFVSDHMEVIYDLDVEAKSLAESLGINLVRAGTAGSHKAMAPMIRELIQERTAGAPVKAVGSLETAPVVCQPGCCPSGRPPVTAAAAHIRPEAT